MNELRHLILFKEPTIVDLNEAGDVIIEQKNFKLSENLMPFYITDQISVHKWRK